MLDVAAKRRLTGAVVLVVLAVVFLPMMMEEDALEDPVPEDELAMPEPPPRAGGRQAEIFQNFDAPGGRAGPGSVADYAPEPDSDAELEALPNLGDEVPAPEPAEAATPVLAPDTAAAAASAEKTTQETAPEAPKSATVAAPAPAPAPAKPKPVPKGVGSWVVQVAALGTPEAAARLEGKLRAQGLPAFVERLDGTKRTLWRVRVGPEVERGRADAMAAEVKRRMGLDAYVQKYGGR